MKPQLTVFSSSMMKPQLTVFSSLMMKPQFDGFFVINDGLQFDGFSSSMMDLNLTVFSSLMMKSQIGDILNHVKFYVAPAYLLRSNKSNLSPGSYHGVVLPWVNPKKTT